MMWWGDGYAMGWGWVIGGVVLLLVIAAVVTVVLATTRPPHARYPAGTGQATPGATARQIIDERYAKGELTTDEYKERIATLGSGS
jgi:putative membrane protein